jgi:hypothetical protein
MIGCVCASISAWHMDGHIFLKYMIISIELTDFFLCVLLIVLLYDGYLIGK